MRYICLMLCYLAAGPASADWPAYAGEGGRQHTDLTQITPTNVADLRLAWRADLGSLSEDFRAKGHSFQANPIFWDGKLYVSTSANEVFAVDAVSGAVVWQFDARLDREAGYSESASRGVTLWHGDSAVCPHRVVFGTLMGELIALDARTGSICTDFGDGGRVDLATGARAQEPGDYSITSPPALLGDVLIVGSAIGDNRRVDSELGIVRALDVRSGQVLWAWDPIPRDAADAARAGWSGNSADITGAANAWPPLLADAEAGLVFVSTSSPSPDFFGGERLGDNRYANSLVALDATTGTVRWHQQLVHHDVWDYDVPSQPTRFALHRDGKLLPAVAVVTKTAQMFVFHRDTGEPLFDVEERAVPQGGVDGELLSPTQPFSALPMLVEDRPLTAEDAFGVVYFDRKGCERILDTYRSEGMFTPPSLEGSIMNPGYPGGANWGGVAIDEARQIAVVNVNRFAVLVKLIPRDDYRREDWQGGDWQLSAMRGTPYIMARRVFLSALGLPCTQPPWGKLMALDLAAGKLLWEQPLGTIEDLAPAPVPNFAWGVPNMGGALLTASGLTIIGAAGDYYLRAYDTASGKLVWSHRLPTAAMATPMSYEMGGRQYVAVAVGGHTNVGLKRGNHLMSFALPD